MKRLLPTLAAAGLILTGTVATAPGASAADRTCRGTIGKVTVDNIKVPKGATCTLKGTRVKGNVTVASGAALTAHSMRVDGNVQSSGHRSIALGDNVVDGSIQLKSGGKTYVNRNIVDGDIQIFSNKRGAKNVYDNRVDGNLQCKSNTPAPKGARNKVKGNKEGQCRKF